MDYEHYREVAPTSELAAHHDAFERARERVIASAWFKNRWVCKTGLWPGTGAPQAIVLKLSKPHWSHDPMDAINSKSGVFFSVWIDEASLKNGRLLYNLHALKLRELKEYRLESRKFAEAFRKAFQPLSSGWPNVRTDFGPQTLFEGYLAVTPEEFELSAAALAEQFHPLGNLIDELLGE